MKIRHLFSGIGLLVCALSVPAAAEYELGHGYSFSDALTVGGYFSTEFKTGDDLRELVVDDIAVLTYERISNFSCLVELESVNFYVSDLGKDTEEWNTASHRSATSSSDQRLHACGSK
jgi:hypothetical protein